MIASHLAHPESFAVRLRVVVVLDPAVRTIKAMLGGTAVHGRATVRTLLLSLRLIAELRLGMCLRHVVLVGIVYAMMCVTTFHQLLRFLLMP
jgi:hypothetical protein